MATLITKLIIRNDTAANWAAQNPSPTLAKGEVGIEWGTDATPKIKIGNGADTWADLPYFGGTFVVSGSGNTIVDASYNAATGTLTLTKGDRVTGNNLTANNIVLGSGGVGIKTSSVSITTDSNSNSDNTVLTSKAVHSLITSEKGVTSIKITDDDVVVVDKETEQTGSVTYALSHAKKGPLGGATKGPAAGLTLDATNKSGTITIPRVVVDSYGHTTGLTEQTLSITFPTAADLGVGSALQFKSSVT